MELYETLKGRTATLSDADALHAVCPECSGTHYITPMRVRTRTTCRTCRAKFRYERTSIKGDVYTFDVTQITPPTGVRTAPTRKLAGTNGAAAKIDEERVEEIARRAAAEVVVENTGNVVTLSAPVKFDSVVDLDDRHEAYAEVMECLAANGKVALVGPPGGGKSSMMRQIAKDLKKGFSSCAVTEGISEAHILGRQNIHGDYIVSEFIDSFEGNSERFEGGGLHLWDECDAGDANTLLCVQEALTDAATVSLPNRSAKPYAERHEGFLQAAAMNTFGTGTSVEFTGRNALDAAFLDRFVGCIVHVGYDKKREHGIATKHLCEPLAEVLWKIRDNVMNARIRRPVSTRAFIHLGTLHSLDTAKYTYRVCVERFFAGWSENEKEKALEGIDLDALDKFDSRPAPKHVATPQDEERFKSSDVSEPNAPHVAGIRCPRCNSAMVERIARRGRYSGNKFHGCSNYPECRGTRKIED